MKTTTNNNAQAENQHCGQATCNCNNCTCGPKSENCQCGDCKCEGTCAC